MSKEKQHFLEIFFSQNVLRLIDFRVFPSFPVVQQMLQRLRLSLLAGRGGRACGFPLNANLVVLKKTMSSMELHFLPNESIGSLVYL